MGKKIIGKIDAESLISPNDVASIYTIKENNVNYEQKYKRLLIGETIKVNKYTIYELMLIMNGELNINTLSFQKSGRDTYYIRVDEPTKQYYMNKFKGDL